MNRDKKITAAAFVTGGLLAILFSVTAIAATTDEDAAAAVADENTTAESEQSTASTDDAMSAHDTDTIGEFLIDISKFKCEKCPFEEGFSGEIEVGVGNVSDDSFKFGEYNGLYEEGAFAVVNAKARYRDLDASYLDISARELGLDSRSLNIEGGRQGRYDLMLRYDEIGHYISDTVRTPYQGNGSASLSLPAGWVTANSTAGMTALDASLQSVEVKQQRTRLELGASLIPASAWKYDLNVRRETREGNRRAAGAFLSGSFFSNAAELIEPVDYVTDEVDVSASYIGKKWQATLAYYGSFFSNDDDALTWENAFTPVVAGADTGQRALPPDNKFHQILLSAGYSMSKRTRLSGDIAVGRMEQDEEFLPATINTSLTVPALPRTSADAQVDTLVADLRLVSAISRDFKINASMNYSDHDNQTPQSSYDRVITDAVVAAARTNQPYSFTRQRARLGGDYRVNRSTRVAAGLDYERYERELQEVDETKENTVWGKLIVRARDFTDMTFRVAQANRNASAYQPVAETDPAQNPLLRKYNMADRERSSAGVSTNSMLSETASFGISLDYANDDYDESTLGLIEASESSINIDTSVLLSERSSLHLFLGRQRIQSLQTGSQSATVADWTAQNTDTVDSAGIGLKHRLKGDRLDVGADLVLSRSTGQVIITSGAPEAFPELEVDLDSIKLYADYRLRDNMSIHAAYWYERYDSSDWAVDNVDPDTVANLLSFGEDSPDYEINVVTVSLRYKF